MIWSISTSAADFNRDGDRLEIDLIRDPLAISLSADSVSAFKNILISGGRVIIDPNQIYIMAEDVNDGLELTFTKPGGHECHVILSEIARRVVILICDGIEDGNE